MVFFMSVVLRNKLIHYACPLELITHNLIPMSSYNYISLDSDRQELDSWCSAL